MLITECVLCSSDGNSHLIINLSLIIDTTSYVIRVTTIDLIRLRHTISPTGDPSTTRVELISEKLSAGSIDIFVAENKNNNHNSSEERSDEICETSKT